MSVRAEKTVFELCPVTKKRMFVTKAKAHVHASRVARKNKTRGDRYPLHVYRCDACNAFHVGHDPTFRRNRKPKSHPWRAWNPGWLQRGADERRAERIIPAHARLR